MLAEGGGGKNRRSMRLHYGIFSPPSFRRASARLLLLSSSSATVRPGCCPLVPSSVAPSPAASTGEGILTRAARGTAGGSDQHLQDLLSVSTIWDFPLGEKRRKKKNSCHWPFKNNNSEGIQSATLGPLDHTFGQTKYMFVCFNSPNAT